MLYIQKKLEDCLLGIWKVEETSEELLSMLQCKKWLNHFLTVKSAARIREMLATRVLLKKLLGEEKEICYFASGKPYLADGSYQISISHTRGYVALVLNKKQTMGLDIEQRTDKIFRVRDRVVSSTEFICDDNQQVHLLLHWSAKEAMFKYLNAEGVDFRGNLHVSAFQPEDEGFFEVQETKTVQTQVFRAYYLVTDDFVLVCLLEKDIVR